MPVTATSNYSNGRWTVTLSRPLGSLPGLKNLADEDTLTLGLALHGKDNPGGKHWVSLPLTLGFGGSDTDFLAR